MNEHRDLWWDSPTRELGKVLHLDLEGGFEALHGGRLERIQVSYESWGERNAASDNVVLLIHPMTSDCHATGEFEGQARGFWEDLIGPGRAIDTNQYHVLCPNLLGGCYGTTGPRFPAEDGAPYFMRFPLLTPRDMMRVLSLFVRRLGIERLRMVIGPSMGGMMAWEWAIESPEMVDDVVIVAAPLRTTPLQIGWNWLQRRGIELDMTQNEVVAKFGQMVARGVGMLSYRSPVGLEEKFGREWFQEPGSTLEKRGMFNIESWLRQHGKRITKRFDPYTYLLFSRAMDLHDVSAHRGSLVEALGRVTCRMLVVGISTDNLYPPQDVHMAADMLRHLGRPAQYAEIRSLHGHDGVFLETEQLSAILRGYAAELRRSTPRGTPLLARPVRMGVVGAGRVATSLAKLIEERHDELARRHGIDVSLRAVAEIDETKELDPIFANVPVLRRPEELIARQDLDVIVELTRATDTAPFVQSALRRGLPVVTPNKPLIREHGSRFEDLALEKGVRLAFHDSLAAGWPLMYAVDPQLSNGQVRELDAVISSTCNLVLERIAEGGSLEDGLREAAELEITETDLSLDVSGWDTAQKLCLLLSRARGRRVAFQTVSHRGLDTLDPQLVRAAEAIGLRVKMVALARDVRSNLRTWVGPAAVKPDSHLGMVRKDGNVVVLRTEDAGEMVYAGSRPGILPVATAVLNDVIGLFDAQYSWTGRFPVDSAPVPGIEFESFLRLDASGRAQRSSAPTADAIPIVE